MNPLILPLTLGKDDTFRVSWKKRFFQAKGALVLPQKMTRTSEVLSAIENLQFVVRLTEFKSALRSKILSTLAEPTPSNGSTAETEVFGVVTQINLKTGQVISIEDARRAVTQGPAEAINFMSESAQVLTLSDEEKAELLNAFNCSLTAPVIDALRQPFVAFCPELSETWKEQNLSSIQPDKLVPFQLLFPNGQPIERIVDGERYVIDDLYCTNPQCSCTDVTCVVLKFLPMSGTEVAWGGFKWNIETDKFKPMPQFSNKFNAAEWFKQFNAALGFELKFLLSSRQKFMRNQYIAARKAAKN